jgi:hypothetical protein
MGWLLAGAVCIGVGYVLVRRSRVRGGHRVVAVVLVVAGAGWIVAPPSASQALAVCDARDGSSGHSAPQGLAIEQSSVIDGLGPLAAPAPIEGTITNLSDGSTYVTDVTVSIAAVVKAAGAPAGSCSADDYVLRGGRMTVHSRLAGHSSLPFGGAALGFDNSAVNQDGCKGAIVHLRYVSDSG